MSRVYQSTDLTEPQADAAIAAALRDSPAASDTEKTAQPNGLFTVVCSYDDSTLAQSLQLNGDQSQPVQSLPVRPVQNGMAPTPANRPGTVNGATSQPLATNQPVLSLGMLQRHWPKAAPDILQGIASTAATVFSDNAINTPLRVAHFMAQISEECGAGAEMVENLNYSAQQLMKTWPSRFPTVESTVPYVNNPRALADKVYNGRMGNRAGTDDGYVFRGHGCLQLTGRSSYAEIGQICHLDLVGNPNLAISPQSSLLVAVTEFVKAGCLRWCDDDSVMEVSALVNLGHLTNNPTLIEGFTAREAWLKIWKKEFGL